MKQPTAAPTRKVAAGTGAGAAAIILVWVTGLFGLDVPAEVSAAVATLITLGAAYVTSERGLSIGTIRGEHRQEES